IAFSRVRNSASTRSQLLQPVKPTRQTEIGKRNKEQMNRRRALIFPVPFVLLPSYEAGLDGIWVKGSRCTTLSTIPYSRASWADMNLSQSVSSSIFSKI